MLVTYGADQIPAVWYSVEPFVKRAIDRGSNWTLEAVYTRLCESRLQLWTYQDPKLQAAMTTGIDGDKCYLVTLGGQNIKSWIDCFPIIERWAIMEGCDSIVIHGRKGWAKLLGLQVVGKDELGLYILERRLWDQVHNQHHKPRQQSEAASVKLLAS